MHLKKLTLQAFGPFKDKVVIDFEKEGIDNGLLLISGDTGAGKTTIFDAICYALYGQSSGKDRKPNSLRSGFASPDIDTFVNLEFYYKNKLYEVERIPEYTRRKKYGEGLTTQDATAHMIIDGRTVTGSTNVKNEVQQLIGLDYDQFRQVAMLSQGEFSKFLLAPSSEKTTIFRRIFATEFYQDLQAKLKEDSSSLEYEIKDIKTKIGVEKKSIEDIIDLDSFNNDEMIEALNNKIKEDCEAVEQAMAQRDEKFKKITVLSGELASLKELNKNISDYQEAFENLQSLLASNPNIDEERERYDYNVKIANPIFTALKLLNETTGELNIKKEKCIQNKNDLAAKQKEYKEKEEDFKIIDTYHEDSEKLSKLINELSSKNDAYDKVKELNDVKEECKKISGDYEKQNAEYEKIRKGYYLNISVEIAEKELVDGEPCPVCGSKEHPKKAVPTESEYTKKDVETAEKKLKDIGDLRKTKEGIIEEMRNTIKGYGIPEDIDVSSKKEENTKKLEEKEKEKDELSKSFERLSKEKDELCKSINGFKEKIGLLTEDIEKLEGKIEEQSTELDNLYDKHKTNKEEYMSKRLDDDSFAKLKKKIADFDEKKNKAESTIERLEEQVEDKEIVDLSEIEGQLNALNGEYKELDKNYTNLKSALDKLESSTKNIEQYVNDGKKIQTEYDIVKVLSDTANGSLPQKQKVSFEDYVQAYYMKSVLDDANNRFVKMTDSRYKLKRKETDISLREKSSLDFSVFDSYTGDERDVTSLSGGEQFKASLALALGLSDVISNKRGGIKLNSLFIDEGFGSLDSESLDQALNVLYDLSGKDKLIGVISHVAELKTRIDNKILVNKTNAGSGINIETNI